MLNPLGRNWGPQVNWDSLGQFYAGFAIAWTVILYSGIAWLIVHRKLPYLKIRNVPLLVAATSFLHVYLIKILLAYTTNGNFLCSAEFWIMSIYLPFGIALFQANMVQILSISTQQQKLLEGNKVSIRERVHQQGFQGLWSRWGRLNSLKQTFVLIGIGMLLEVVMTAAIYGTNEKLQGKWGNVAKPTGQMKCRKGFEWIPSSFWQLFWSGVYGPYLLYKVRNVRDAHYWRLQTILCVISGIPGSPLWLAAVFSPKFKSINRYWVPPMWLAPGILAMQACAIFFPIFEYSMSHRLSKTTAATLRAWENRESWDDTTLASRSTTTARSSIGDATSARTIEYKNSKMYTMAALEEALATNPTPILYFAATKDFTAENIIFLLAVREWRAAWGTKVRDELFYLAVDIYANYVNEKLAEFPINIEGSIRSRLDAIFASAISDLDCHYQSNVDPFNDAVPLAGAGILMKSLQSTAKEIDHDGLDIKMFDAAEKSIKYLVVTNTWRKYVSRMKDTRASEETVT